MLSLLLLSLELLLLLLLVLVSSSALVVELLLPVLPVASPLPIVESSAVVVESPRVSGPDDEELDELDEEEPSSE